MEVDLGRFFLCLSVDDIDRSLDFYETLGFQMVDGESDSGWAIIEREAIRLGLFKGGMGRNVLNFLDGNVMKVAELLMKKGIPLVSEPVETHERRGIATVEDPDGNLITIAGVFKPLVGSIPCPRCRSETSPTGREFLFGVFKGRSFACGGCGKSFNAYFRDDEFSHTVPKPAEG